MVLEKKGTNMIYVFKRMTEDNNITLTNILYYNTEDNTISIKKINEDYKNLQQLYKSNNPNFEQNSSESLKQ